jgi:hypothetical protein
MVRCGSVVVAIVTALAVGACDDDDTRGDRREGSPVACTPTPAPSGGLAVRAHFKTGDAREVTIRSSLPSPVGEGKLSGSVHALVRVLRGGKRGALLRFQYRKVKLPQQRIRELDTQQRQLFDRVAAFLSRMVVEYRTDREGRFKGVANLPALRRGALRELDAGKLETPGLPSGAAMTRRLIASDERLAESSVRDIRFLHGAYGVRIGRGTTTSRYELANPWIGEPLEVTARLTLLEARDDSGCAEVQIDPELDPHTAAAAYAKSVGAIAGSSGRAPRSLPYFQTLRYTYDPGSGWIVRGAKDEFGGFSQSLDVTVGTPAGAE